MMQFNFLEIEPKVKQVLCDALGQHTKVETEEVDYGRVFVKVIAPQFNDMSMRKRQDAVWNAINSLGSEAQAVSLVLAFGTDEI